MRILGHILSAQRVSHWSSTMVGHCDSRQHGLSNMTLKMSALNNEDTVKTKDKRQTSCQTEDMVTMEVVVAVVMAVVVMGLVAEAVGKQPLEVETTTMEMMGKPLENRRRCFVLGNTR